MRLARFCILAVLALAAGPVLAGQQELSPEQKADTEGLRAIVAATADLPMDKAVLTITPARQLSRVSAVTADAQGNVYALHRVAEVDALKGTDPVVVLDPNGTVLKSMGKDVAFGIPHGIRVDASGNVWVIDANQSIVVKFSPAGAKLLQIDVGDIPEPDRPFCGATDVAFGDSGTVYVSDGYCNSRVIEYAADGTKVREWGKRGTGPGEFLNVHGIALGGDGLIYVADRENGRVQWFEKDGTYLGEKKFGGQLYSVALDAAGKIYVGTQPRGVPLGTDSYVFKFDRATGDILGKVATFGHQLSIGPGGSLLPGTIATEVVVFRPRS